MAVYLWICCVYMYWQCTFLEVFNKVSILFFIVT